MANNEEKQSMPAKTGERKKLGKRQRFEMTRSALENERSSFITHWRELGDFILPRRPRFLITDVNKGDRRNNKIIDSTATTAARTLSSGMMAGMTSPARPWFKITTRDPALAEAPGVKEWLRVVEKRMAAVFLRCNLYTELPEMYGDLGVFGTSAMLVEEDFDNVMRFYVFPVGSYTIAMDASLRVRVFFREFQMTVRQVVEKYAKFDDEGNVVDWSNISETVKDYWENAQDDVWIGICHIIAPNSEYDTGKLASKYKKFLSCTYERGTSGAESGNYMRDDAADGLMLRESGYDYFPVFCPRWGKTGEDVYGTSCPGMDSLGDVKGLQTLQKRKAQVNEKHVNPPMKGPAVLRNKSASIIAGNITYVDEREGQKGFTPVHEVKPNTEGTLLDIQDHHKRIKRVFFEDLFLALSQTDRREITAREVDEVHEEKLIILGPVLERLNLDVNDPLIDIAFLMMDRQGLIPEAPEELQGQELKVEYVSIMAQAQKLVGIAGMERFASFVKEFVSVTGDPSSLDKVDADQMVNEYADAAGVPTNIIRTDDAVEEIRKVRAEALEESQRAEKVAMAGKTAKDLSEADLGGGKNALSEIVKSAKAGNPAPQQ